MEVLRVIAESDVPSHTLQVDEEERPGLIWWKRKKWALHTLTRLFERYGSPGSVTKEYKEFAEWYLKTFSGGILTSMLKNLDQFRRKMYVSPRVMQQALNYVNTAISHAHSWKLIKPHMLQIIQDIVFPLMSYSESDAEMWDTDPYEYIRIKFDIFEGESWMFDLTEKCVNPSVQTSCLPSPPLRRSSTPPARKGERRLVNSHSQTGLVIFLSAGRKCCRRR